MISQQRDENSQQGAGAGNVVLPRHELLRLGNIQGHVIKVVRDSEEMISFQLDTFDLAFLADNILVYFVNFGVDDVELLHPQHTRHCLWLDCAQVRVVYGQPPAVEESSEGVGDQLEEVEKVQLEMFHSLQPVEGVLTNDGAEIRSSLSDYTAAASSTATERPHFYTAEKK